MTSLKGPSTEHGDTTPDLDVLTGPPASPAVAAQEPAAEGERMPFDDVDRQFLIETPPPPARAEAIPEPAPRSDGSVEAMPAPATEPQHILPMVMPTAADSGGLLDFASFVRAEVIYEGTPTRAAEIAPTRDAPSALPEPIAPATLPEILAQSSPAAFAAPVLNSAITAPAAVVLEPPTQPVPPLASPPPIAVPAAKPARPRWRVWLRRMLLAFFGVATGYAVLVLVLIVVYRYVDPPRSTVMLGVNLSGQSVDHEPVPLSSISTYLLRAVVTSEDARFCRHNGVDWGALAEAIQDSRGGSTITMQVAKNLFLWPSRSYIRKAIEIPVALMIDFAWPKRRILEVYLNIAEWGPGVFGAEAAAQYHFGKPASRLTQHEATLLAASLPNPIAREAGDPGRVTELLASRLRARMANSDAYVGCLGIRPMPRAEPERAPKRVPPAATKSALKPWQTRTEPVKPPAPFNPWQN